MSVPAPTVTVMDNEAMPDPTSFHCPDGPPGSHHVMWDRRGLEACTYCGTTLTELVVRLTPPIPPKDYPKGHPLSW